MDHFLGKSLAVCLFILKILPNSHHPSQALEAVKASADKDNVRDNQQAFLFISGERAGGSRILRMAIRQEVNHLVNDMACDMQTMPPYQGMPLRTLQMVCHLLVNTMLSAAPEILDLPADQVALEQIMEQGFVQQLQLILLGALAWRDI